MPLNIGEQLHALERGSPAEQRQAATELGLAALSYRVALRSAVPALISALASDDVVVRLYAIDALPLIGDRRAVEPLVGCLADRRTRRAAAAALSHFGDSRCVVPLCEALASGSTSDREEAAWGLRRLPHSDAAHALCEALGDESALVRRLSAEALRALADPRAVVALSRALFDHETDVAVAAASALLQTPDPAATEPLCWARATAPREVADLAAQALDRIVMHRAIPDLCRLLEADHPEVTAFAARQLRAMGSSTAMIEAALSDADVSPGYCFTVIEALRRVRFDNGPIVLKYDLPEGAALLRRWHRSPARAHLRARIEAALDYGTHVRPAEPAIDAALLPRPAPFEPFDPAKTLGRPADAGRD